jgi:hypothetical protein
MTVTRVNIAEALALAALLSGITGAVLFLISAQDLPRHRNDGLLTVTREEIGLALIPVVIVAIGFLGQWLCDHGKAWTGLFLLWAGTAGAVVASTSILYWVLLWPATLALLLAAVITSISQFRQLHRP